MEMRLFEYKSDDHLDGVRTVEIEGEIWFVASDVTKVLGYGNTSAAISRHCKSGGITKRDIDSDGGSQNMILINEPNLYRLIVRSQLDSAEKFENRIFQEVLPSIRSKGFYGKIDRAQLPNFIERYKENYHKIPYDHFSIISELFATLYQEFEKVGYQIPNRAEDGKQIMVDISVGKMFSNFLDKQGSDHLFTRKQYQHEFSDGRKPVDARMYSIDALPMFKRFVFEVWIPENADKYFKTRDPQALKYIPKILGLK